MYPLDPVILAGMIFSVVVLLLIGGFVLLYPVARQLGEYLRHRIQQGDRAPEEQVEELRRAVESLRNDVAHLAERQDFTERLLEPPRRGGGEP